MTRRRLSCAISGWLTVSCWVSKHNKPRYSNSPPVFQWSCSCGYRFFGKFTDKFLIISWQCKNELTVSDYLWTVCLVSVQNFLHVLLLLRQSTHGCGPQIYFMCLRAFECGVRSFTPSARSLRMLIWWVSSSSAVWMPVGSVWARSAPPHTHTPAQVGLTM